MIESIVRDQIVLGVASEQVREKLPLESGLTLTKACNIVRACESASSQLTQMTARTDLTVHRLMDSSSKGRPASQPNKLEKSCVVCALSGCVDYDSRYFILIICGKVVLVFCVYLFTVC